MCTFFSPSNQLASRHKFGRKIKAIKERLDKIRNDRGFHLEERQVVTRSGREDIHSYVPEEEVIGRDGDRRAIIRRLLDDRIEENVSVVSIIGIGGLGKTTLAQLVFNDENVQKHFHLRMWVYVSPDFSVRSVVEKIIKSATDKGLENLEMDQLQKLLRREIDGKRYLLVLDDVWNENREEWRKLEILLSACGKGSRIMVTTRSEVVGEIMSSTMAPYILGRLNEDESWTLFKKVACKLGEEPSNAKIVGIGKEIVERCGGIPLAIRTIGRTMYFKDPETEWSSFLKLEFSRLPQEKTDILPTLKLSYDNLPPHLKHCFALCNLFPKGHEIDVDMLINLWMAQGCINWSSNSAKSLADVGYEYLSDLHWRSFFQEVDDVHWMNLFNMLLKKQDCKMHDLMHDLAKQVGGTRCAILLRNERGDLDKNTHHVTFNFHLDSLQQIPTTLSRTNKIRSILLLGQSSSTIQGRQGQSICDAVVSNFKLLRFLDLHNMGIEVVPNCIGKLRHLRYLDLSRNKDIKALPNSITMLCNLHTLKFSDCQKLRELPANMKKLVNLLHLDIAGCDGLAHMPQGLDQMTNLRTLPLFVLKVDYASDFWSRPRGPRGDHEVGVLSDLMGLNNLRGALEIVNLGNGEDTMKANLKEKKHLHSLLLCWRPVVEKTNDSLQGVIDYEATLEGLSPHPNLKRLTITFFNGVRFSSWLPSLANLEVLFLENCRKCQYLPPLNQFHSLKQLSLLRMDSLEYISSDSFAASSSSTTILPSLQNLFFGNLPNLKGWWCISEADVDDDDNSFAMPLSSSRTVAYFPRLADFYYINCPKLSFLPLSSNMLGLTVGNKNWKSFQHVMSSISTRQQMHTTAKEEEEPTASPSSSLSTSVSPFPKLIRFLLTGINDLHSLPEWLKYLTSIDRLIITNCDNFKCLSPGLQYLDSLKQLYIVDCQQFDMSNDVDGFKWQASKTLRVLFLVGLPRLETLPEGIKHVRSLEVLRIKDCAGFVGIPECISNLQSLSTLKITRCQKFASLPKGIRQLKSLQKLKIKDCNPNIYKRCQREVGEDWPAVAHIPELILKSSAESSGTYIDYIQR